MMVMTMMMTMMKTTTTMMMIMTVTSIPPGRRDSPDFWACRGGWGRRPWVRRPRQSPPSTLRCRCPRPGQACRRPAPPCHSASPLVAAGRDAGRGQRALRLRSSGTVTAAVVVPATTVVVAVVVAAVEMGHEEMRLLYLKIL